MMSLDDAAIVSAFLYPVQPPQLVDYMYIEKHTLYSLTDPVNVFGGSGPVLAYLG